MITQRMMCGASESKDAILFTTSAAGSNINFFSDASTTATPLSDYDVYINGAETSQQYNSLTFSRGDVVKIKAKDSVNAYPVFNANGKNYLLSIDAPFPRMVDASGDVTSFIGCFRNCSSLTSIPEDLFKYNTAVTSFYQCFNACSSLTSIPEDLFKYNIKVTNFQGCFYNCTSLTSIPEGLFNNNTAVTSFIGCFRNCSSLTSIPADLFRYNTKVTNFTYCFNACSSLTSIPEDLFKYNTVVGDFSYCFSDCKAVTSALPTLWISHRSAAGTRCFRNCTKASNYSSVPSSWK